MTNAIAEFQDKLQEVGLGRPDIVADGGLHRFHVEGDKPGSKSGSYTFHPDDPPAGYYENFKTGAKGTWCAKGRETRTEAERAAIREEAQRNKAERDRAQAEQYRQAAGRAESVWCNAAALQGGHPYLQRKGVAAHGNVRVTVKEIKDGSVTIPAGSMVLPVRNAAGGAVQTLQFIFPEKQSDRDKHFLAGGKKADGLIRVHGDVETASCIFLAEGYATACTVAEAAGDSPEVAVVATLDAGNMPRVAAILKAKRPEARFILCGDNDWGTEQKSGKNPGREAAEKAAKATGGKVMLPPPEEGVTDWNDYAARAGMETVKAALTVLYEHPAIFRGDLAEWAGQNFMEVSGPEDDVYWDGEKALVWKTVCPLCHREASLRHGTTKRVEFVHEGMVEDCELDGWMKLRGHFEPSFREFAERWEANTPEKLFPADEGSETLETVETCQAPSGVKYEDNRERVMVSTCESRTADRAVAILHKETELFQRGGNLVRVVDSDAGPAISEAKAAWLRDALSRQARFVKVRTYKDGTTDDIPCLVPEWLVPIILERKGAWPGVRALRAVVETPIFLPGGRILADPGYDPETGILYTGRAVKLDVPHSPVLADAEKALNVLFDVVGDFPFAESPSPAAHRAAWLANVLTLVARFVIDGPVPFFIYDASLRGSGKGILSTVTCIIALGHPTPTSQASGDHEELRKNILPLVMSGRRVVVLDELGPGFGGRFWNNLVTSWPLYSDRLLGQSAIITAPAFTVWMCTGNGVTLAAESTRRAIPIRLEPLTDKPEDRTGFKYPDLVHHVSANKDRLLSAALTILAAYQNEGCPCNDHPPLGSFESWSRVVRNTVLWITGEDPVSTQRGMASMLDEHDAAAATVIRHADKTFSGPFTAKRFLESAIEDDVKTALEALRGGMGRSENLSVRAVGRILAKLRGRVSEGKRLMVSGDSNMKSFSIVSLAQVSTVSTVSAPSFRGNNFSREQAESQLTPEEQAYWEANARMQ